MHPLLSFYIPMCCSGCIQPEAVGKFQEVLHQCHTSTRGDGHVPPSRMSEHPLSVDGCRRGEVGLVGAKAGADGRNQLRGRAGSASLRADLVLQEPHRFVVALGGCRASWPIFCL